MTACSLVWLFSIFTTQIVFAMVEVDNSTLDQLYKNALKKCHILVTNAKQKLLLSLSHCSNCTTVSFPVCCHSHTENTRREPQVKSLPNKHSQASFCLRCQDKEQSCSHCPHAMIEGRQYLLQIPWKNEKKERESWVNASESCTSAKRSPTRFLPLMPQPDSIAFAITGNVRGSPAKSRGSYQPSCKGLQLLLLRASFPPQPSTKQKQKHSHWWVQAQAHQ